MTPKEKAYELIDKMSIGKSYQGISEGLWLNSANNKYRHLCALIAVDEIIPIIKSYEDALSASQKSDELEYWQQVKKEIKKL